MTTIHATSRSLRIILTISLFALRGGLALAQETATRLVNGVVVEDSTGEPLPGVTVYAPASSTGTTTNPEGRFELRIDIKEKTLRFSFIGMQTYELALKSDKQEYRVALLEEVRKLDEVVVTGYQTISKERTTGSFEIIDKDELSAKINPSLFARMEGTVAGIQGRSEVDLSIRGVATLLGNSHPLIVVDGMPIEGSLSSINPATIAKITVLKDAAAASIYGARAANGVIVINTIDGKQSHKSFEANYDGMIQLTSRPDYDYLHRMSSAELVDLSMEIISRRFGTVPWSALEMYPTAFPYTLELFTKHTEGILSDEEYAVELERIRTTNNVQTFREQLLRTGLLHTHNLSLLHKSDKNGFVATINYRGDRPTDTRRTSDDIGYTLRNTTHFSDRLKTDLSVAGHYANDYILEGCPDVLGLFYSLPSYVPLVGEDGSYLSLPTTRSEYSKRQLLQKGLEDESYNPLRDRSEEWTRELSNYTRINAQISYRALPTLSLSGALLLEHSTGYDKDYATKESYKVRQMRNDATIIGDDGKHVSLVPKGGQLSERRSSTTGYTVRGQLTYDRSFGEDHRMTFLAGAEARRLHSTATRSYLMGYDDISLGSVPYDAQRLSNLQNTQSLSGTFSFNQAAHNYVQDTDDRFVSFYTNLAYGFMDRYNLTSSVRIDQSNLFGVDPKVQYRPLWSFGGSWTAHKEEFMSSLPAVNRLVLRLTYGIGGNIPKVGGPYMIVRTGVFNEKAGVAGSTIVTPPNRSLTWERTATLNLGVDFALLRNRLTGSVELYDRETTNLLGNRLTDPTIGWNTVLMNYGSMRNAGVELTLDVIPIATSDFRWTIGGVFSYNHNKILNIDEESKTVDYYLTHGVSTNGKPANSLYSLEWAGLYTTDSEGKKTELGAPHIYTRDEEGSRRVATQTRQVSDLIHEGTMTPVWHGGLTNTIEHKDLSLSFSLVYYGGHKLRDVMSPYISNYDFLIAGVNADRGLTRQWRKEGDEISPDVTPLLPDNTPDKAAQYAWYGANIHVIEGDYIRLRNVVLAYSLPRRLLSTMHLTSCTLRVQADNLFLLTKNTSGIDPEAYSFGFGEPPVRLPKTPATYTLGLSFGF